MPIFNRPGGGGPSPEPAPNNTQIYYEYIFDASVIYDTTSTATQNATAPAAGFIRANNANTAIATVFAVANQTFNSQGIGTYMDRQAAGLDLNLRGVNAQKFGVYNMESAPTSGSGHRKFIVTPVNGLALADQDRIALSFTSTGNVKSNPTTGNLEVNNVPVAPNILTVDTLAEAVSLVTVNAANDRKEFAVLDPGNNASNVRLRPRAWNMLVNNTTGELMQIGGIQEFACNRRVFNIVTPAVNCSARATDSTILTGKLKLTCTAHLLTTGVPAIDTYIPVQTASAGWTALELVKVLSVSDANSIIVDKDAASVTTNPDLVLINEEFRALTINNPYPLRAASRLKYFFSLAFPVSAGTKSVSGRIGAIEYWGGGGVSFTANQKIVTREIHIQAMNATNAQQTTVIANTNSGDGVVNSASTIPSSTANTTAAFAFDLYGTLTSAADYFQVTIASAEAGY